MANMFPEHYATSAEYIRLENILIHRPLIWPLQAKFNLYNTVKPNFKNSFTFYIPNIWVLVRLRPKYFECKIIGLSDKAVVFIHTHFPRGYSEEKPGGDYKFYSECMDNNLFLTCRRRGKYGPLQQYFAAVFCHPISNGVAYVQKSN